MHRWQLTLVLLAVLAGGIGMPTKAEERFAMPNLKLPTLGGKQFWADVHFLHQWRIQRDVVTGHYRLLSPKNVRLAWGTLETCLAELEEVRDREQLPPMRGKAVVVLHGLGRTRGAMARIARTLEERGGYQVFNVGYPTLMGGVARSNSR